MLNSTQAMVQKNTLAGTTYFDADGAAAKLSGETVDGAPHYFLDFETSNSAIPHLERHPPLPAGPLPVQHAHTAPGWHAGAGNLPRPQWG